MTTSLQILNGDALLARLNALITGELIVARECLCDGEVSGDTLDQLYDTRTQFLSVYDPLTRVEYDEKVVVEFNRIQNIPEDAEINLWFEDDLFCQVNLWFVAWLLQESDRHYIVNLVRPRQHTHYGFGGLSEAELLECLKDKLAIKELQEIAQLWQFYKEGNLSELKSHAQQLEQPYPFILPAVQAHLDRQQTGQTKGFPERVIEDLINELGTTEFGPIFQEFSKRLPIYGYGDLQVRRLWQKVVEKGDR